MNTNKKTGQICTGLKLNSKIKKIPFRRTFAVKELEQLANEAARAKNPNTPVEWLAPRKYRDDSANGLTQCIIDYIHLIGGQAERISNTGRQITQCRSYMDVVGFQRSIVNTHWIPGTGRNGTVDISATINGLSVKVEVKFGDDQQSKAQKFYQHDVVAAGGIYLVVHDFQQFFNWFNNNVGGLNNE